MTRVLGIAAVLVLFSAPGSRLLGQNGDAQVVFERTGYRLTSIGGRVAVGARVLDGRRRAVPNAPVAWRIEDSTVAVVNNRGEVQARRVGRTRLWAVSGRDSASALILVDQWAARFAFQPAVLTFSTIGEARTVQMQARDAEGNGIPDIRIATACRVLNPRVASMQGASITSNTSGVTYLRCTDRGVADSLRIEVRPRAASATIVDKAIYTQARTVGDSFQVRMRAVDARGQPIPDARPTWASLEPRVLSVDPLSGWARGVGVGSSKVVAQLGDITDTVDVTVVAGPGMSFTPVTPAGDVTTAAAAETPGKASLAIYALPTAVGDTTNLTIIPRSANNALAEVSAVTLRLTGDTGVARLTRDRRLIGLREGTAWIVGTFGDLTDSSQVTIMAAGTTNQVEVEAAFVRPRYDTLAAQAHNVALIDSTLRRILAGSAIRAPARRHIAAEALVSQVAHAARLSETYLERRTGLLFGGRLVVAPFRRLRLSGSARAGALVADETTPAEDMQLTEADAQLTFMPADWLSFVGGGTIRAQSTEVAVQRWSFASIGLHLHPPLIGNNFRTVVGFTLIPVGKLAETATKSKSIEATSLAGDAGLEFHAGFFTAALLYHAERISFPAENDAQRVDRFSMLRLRLGLQVGR